MKIIKIVVSVHSFLQNYEKVSVISEYWGTW